MFERVASAVRGQLDALDVVSATDLDLTCAGDEARARTYADEAEASPALTALDRLEQKGGRTVIDFQEDAEGRIEIR